MDPTRSSRAKWFLACTASARATARNRLAICSIAFLVGPLCKCLQAKVGLGFSGKGLFQILFGLRRHIFLPGLVLETSSAGAIALGQTPCAGHPCLPIGTKRNNIL